MRSSRTILQRSVLLGALALIAGWLIAAEGGVAKAALAVVAGLVIIQMSGVSQLLAALVAATFVTRFRIVVGGFHLLPEDFVAVCLLLRLVLDGQVREVVRATMDRTVLLLGAFVVWEAAVSLVMPPDPAKSLHIVAWLALDWLILVAVLAARRGTGEIEGVVARCTIVFAAVAVVLWLAYVGAGSTLGTQSGYASGARSVFGLSWEANILASTLAVWGLVTLSSANRSVRRLARLATLLAIVAIAATLTRAAMIGFGLGALVWAAMGYSTTRRRVLRLAVMVVIAGVLLAQVPQITAAIGPRLTDLIALNNGTGAERLQTVRTALGDLHGLRLFVGLGGEAYGQLHYDPTQPGHPGYIGELPVQILYESGVIGVLLLVGALVSLRPLGRKQTGRALGVLVVYLVAASATSPLWLGWTWLLIGLAIMTRPSCSAGYARLHSSSHGISMPRRSLSASLSGR